MARGNERGVQRAAVHYLFEDRYGRPGKGNDKGNVEGVVGYARRNFMTPLPGSRAGTPSMATWKSNAATGKATSCAATARASANGLCVTAKR